MITFVHSASLLDLQTTFPSLSNCGPTNVESMSVYQGIEPQALCGEKYKSKKKSLLIYKNIRKKNNMKPLNISNWRYTTEAMMTNSHCRWVCCFAAEEEEEELRSIWVIKKREKDVVREETTTMHVHIHMCAITPRRRGRRQRKGKSLWFLCHHWRFLRVVCGFLTSNTAPHIEISSDKTNRTVSCSDWRFHTHNRPKVVKMWCWRFW